MTLQTHGGGDNNIPAFSSKSAGITILVEGHQSNIPAKLH